MTSGSPNWLDPVGGRHGRRGPRTCPFAGCTGLTETEELSPAVIRNALGVTGNAASGLRGPDGQQRAVPTNPGLVDCRPVTRRALECRGASGCPPPGRRFDRFGRPDRRGECLGRASWDQGGTARVHAGGWPGVRKVYHCHIFGLWGLVFPGGPCTGSCGRRGPRSVSPAGVCSTGHQGCRPRSESSGDRHCDGGRNPTVHAGGSATKTEKSPVAAPVGLWFGATD